MAEEPSNTPEGSNPGTTGSGCTECLTANFPGGIRSANDMDEAKARADRYVDLLGGNKDGKPPKSETTDQAH